MAVTASDLRVEHLDAPLGIHTQEPRLSWRLPPGTLRQIGYQIRTSNGWDSGRVESDESLLIPYGGPSLRSGERVEWSVKVWTDRGEGEWSPSSSFEMGLFHPGDWRAEWVTPVENSEAVPGNRPAVLLRYEFDVDSPVRSARLYATAHGIYEGFLNGERIGDTELTPGFTQYRTRLQVQAYDVTDLVRPGRNALGVILADGWYRGLIGYFRVADQWGKQLALLQQLHITHADGTEIVVGTSPEWRSGAGHVLAADLIAGERWDLRSLPRGWSQAGFDDSAWRPVSAAALGFDRLTDSPAPPVRRTQELTPVSVRRLDEHRQIVDFGQNINGWVRLTDLGPEGTKVRLVHGEWLDAAGDVTTENLRPEPPDGSEPLMAGQVDEVTSAGIPEDVFEPRRTTHGFQYVRVEGHPDDLTPQDVTGVVVHTDLRRTGWFSCSDERINRLHEAVVWSLRDNACDIPTDCPHRERAGWTGDWQLFIPTAAFLFDVAGFSTKWLRDVAADQWADGTVANISPSAPHEADIAHIAYLNGSAGWGDAAVIVPWELYRTYGDTRILAESWTTIVGWLARVERIARTQRHSLRAAAHPTPAPHEQYLWDTGFHWGEWLVPGEEVDLAAFRELDRGDIATAFYAHSARLAGRIAAILGRDDEALRYHALSDGVRAAWRTEYLRSDGRIAPDTQANHVRALAFDLVPAELRADVAARLAELVRNAETHLGTGFLATPYLLPALADAGHLDLAYELLLQDTEPSWLVMVDRGATTVWEQWNGVSAGGQATLSLNHYSKGAVVSFLHRYVAGIEPLDDAPAHRRFRIQPRPGGGLSWAEAAHETPYGRLESSWRLNDDQLHLRVVVPAGTEATVVLPGGQQEVVTPGTHTFDETVPERFRPAGRSSSDSALS
jgi:alpha-L-rhamnosidase